MDSPATVTVLSYHSIAAHTTPAFAALTVDPSLFDEHMEALHEQNLDVIPFGEVPDALAARRGGVAISIDDGLADAAENACPTLARLGMTATLFIPTGYVGGHAGWLRGEDALRPMLSWATIESLARQGFEIGSHGWMHLAADLNAPELVERDARVSRLELEDRIGRAVSSFAYPFGYHSASGRRAVRAAGYRQACAVGDLPARAGDNRWALAAPAGLGRHDARGAGGDGDLAAAAGDTGVGALQARRLAPGTAMRRLGTRRGRTTSRSAAMSAPGPIHVAVIDVGEPIVDLDCTRVLRTTVRGRMDPGVPRWAAARKRRAAVHQGASRREQLDRELAREAWSRLGSRGCAGRPAGSRGPRSWSPPRCRGPTSFGAASAA